MKEFFFDDDTFNIQKARTVELCAKLKPLKITWSCTSRVTTDRETLKAMKDAGCRLLIVGFESGDPQILKNIKKGATVERARAFAKDCHDLGLAVHGDFVLGLPGETKESIRNTINFAKSLDVETIQVSIAHALPGTELYDYVKANGFMTNATSMSDEGGHQLAHIEYPGLPADYVLEMVHRFYDEYFFRPKQALRVVWKALLNRDLGRLYVEAKSFLKPPLATQQDGEDGTRPTGRPASSGERWRVNRVLSQVSKARPGAPSAGTNSCSQRPRAEPEILCPFRSRAGSPLPDGRVNLNAVLSGHADSGPAIKRPPIYLSVSRRNRKTLMAHPKLSAWQYTILGLVSICAPLGDTCLSRGMTRLPAISLEHPATLIAAVFTPWIAVGIALLIGFFASYLTALSWADLTFVLPATALGNVIVALFARFWLQEPISMQRWAGIALITLGVGFVAQGPSLTERPAAPVELDETVAVEEERVR